MTSVISFISQKGGVGKTASSVSLACAFALSGRKVLLIDLDPQSSVAASLGCSKASMGTKELFTQPNIPIKDYVTHLPSISNLDLLLGNVYTIKDEMLIHKACKRYNFLKDILQEQVENYDIVVVDTPPARNFLINNVIFFSNYTIIPIVCEKLAVRSLSNFLVYFQSVQQLVGTKILLAGILMTMFRFNNEIQRLACQTIYKQLGGIVFRTIIPYDKKFSLATAKQQSIFDVSSVSQSSKAYYNLMAELDTRYNFSTETQWNTAIHTDDKLE